MAHLRGGFGLTEKALRQGLKFVAKDSGLFFNIESAQEQLGMGTLQIEDLRDWLIEAQWIERQGKEKAHRLTELGTVINTHDENCSFDGTYWVLHWKLSRTMGKVQFYNWYVNEFNLNYFNREKLFEEIKLRFNLTKKIANTAYLCPFLQIMRQTCLGKSFRIMDEEEPLTFRRSEPPEDKLDVLIVGYVIMDWAKYNTRTSATIRELVNLPGSPGKVLNLSEGRFCHYLDTLQALFNKKLLRVSYTAGLNSVTFEPNFNISEILEKYYKVKKQPLKVDEILSNYTEILKDRS